MTMKTYARINDGIVAELLATDGDISQMFHPAIVWVDAGSTVAVGDLYSGGAFSKPTIPAPTEAQLEAMAGAAVTSMLDALANSWGYADYKSARTYKGDVSAKYNAEGAAIANFGSACFAYLDSIKAGTHPRPTDTASLLAALPAKPTRPVVS
jgi:hypothetical protein